MSELKPCLKCGREIPRKPGNHYATQKYCSLTCSNSATAAEKNHKRIIPVTPKACEECGELLERKKHDSPAKYAERRFCGLRCAGKVNARVSTAKHAAKVAELIEDLEWVAGTDHPERLAQRLGYSSAQVLSRSLYRWGRADLARLLDPHESEAQAS